jgi:putative membrane protein
LATAAGVSLTAHMVTHLLLGMLGPLLLVLGAPVTLALRALPVRAARGLTRLLRTWPIRLLTHPVPTAVLTVGGLWVLYATDLFRLTQLFSGWHVIVHLHVVFAGYLFTASLVSPDPAPHRAGLALRSSVLTLSLAGHGILAKYLYVHPPAGFGAVDAERAAMVMFYGGDAVDAVLIVLVCREWYRSTAPRPAVVPLGLAAPAGMHGGRPPLR